MNFTIFDSFIFKTQISRFPTDVELAYDNLKARVYVWVFENCSKLRFCSFISMKLGIFFSFFTLKLHIFDKISQKFYRTDFFRRWTCCYDDWPRGCFWKFLLFHPFFMVLPVSFLLWKIFTVFTSFIFFCSLIFVVTGEFFGCFWIKRRFQVFSPKIHLKPTKI